MVMRVGFVDGFDHYPNAGNLLTVWTPNPGPPNITFAPGLSGVGQCLRFSGSLNAGSGILVRVFNGAPSAKVTWNFSFLQDDTDRTDISLVELMDPAGNRQFGFGVTSLGKLGLYGEGGLLVAASFISTPISTVHRICVTVDSTGGANVLTVSINGVVDAGLSINGLDIIDSAISTLFGGMRIQGGWWKNSHRFDDIFVGLDECVQHGAKEVLTSPPDSTILGEFAPSAGVSNHLTVDEVVSNGDVDYNSSQTLNARDVFTFANPARVPENIVSVGIVTSSRKESSATRKIKNILKTGGVEYFGVEHGLAETYLWQEDHWLTNPNGNVPWTPETRDGVEGGYQLSGLA